MHIQLVLVEAKCAYMYATILIVAQTGKRRLKEGVESCAGCIQAS
jgi:hypothetical protein